MASPFSALKAKGQVTFVVVFIPKNMCVGGLYVIFTGILMPVLNSTVGVLVVFEGAPVRLQLTRWFGKANEIHARQHLGCCKGWRNWTGEPGPQQWFTGGL